MTLGDTPMLLLARVCCGGAIGALATTPVRQAPPVPMKVRLAHGRSTPTASGVSLEDREQARARSKSALLAQEAFQLGDFGSPAPWEESSREGSSSWCDDWGPTPSEEPGLAGASDRGQPEVPLAGKAAPEEGEEEVSLEGSEAEVVAASVREEPLPEMLDLDSFMDRGPEERGTERTAGETPADAPPCEAPAAAAASAALQMPQEELADAPPSPPFAAAARAAAFKAVKVSTPSAYFGTSPRAGCVRTRISELNQLSNLCSPRPQAWSGRAGRRDRGAGPVSRWPAAAAVGPASAALRQATALP